MVPHLPRSTLALNEIGIESANNAIVQIWISYEQWPLLVLLPPPMSIITSIILIPINIPISTNNTSMHTPTHSPLPLLLP
jgi:hypothetical protein